MNVDLIFLNRDLLWQVLVASISLWILFVLKEYYQAGFRRFWVKIFITFLAVLSLAVLALKPAFPRKTNNAQAAIITPGHKMFQLDSLERLNPGLKVFEYTPNCDFGKDFKDYQQFFVLGQGIEPFDFWRFENKSVLFLPGEIPNGVNRLHYAQENRRGNDLNVVGNYKNSQKGNRLILADPAGNKMDSVVFAEKKPAQFQLGTSLKVSGNFVYALKELDSLGNLLNSDPLPVSVQEKVPLNVLVLNAYPSFETKYLKNFLAEGKHRLLVRTQISKDRYKTENFNREKTAISTITEENLKDFDLLILDVYSLRSLSGNQKMVLEGAVHNGLGVFVQPEEDFSTISKFLSMDLQKDGLTAIELDEFPGVPFTKYPFQVADQFGPESIQTSAGKPIGFYKKSGKGRIGTTLLASTFQLVLNGNEAVYRKVWSDLASRIARREGMGLEWEGEGFRATKNEPYRFKVRTSLKAPRIFDAQGNAIPVRRDLELDDLWYGVYYPKKTGWNILMSPQDSVAKLKFFVTEASNWKSVHATQKYRENQILFDSTNSGLTTSNETEAISPFWFFLCFLLCLTFLWVEPKW